MANLCRIIWTLVVTITLSVIQIPAMEDDNFIFTEPENDKFPSTSFVPLKLRMSDSIYDRLLVHLGDRLSEEGVDVLVNDFFPKGVESDEEEELEFVHDYDLDDDDEDDDEFIGNLPNDASVSTDFGKHELKFTKVLAISKNGTKTFTKFRQSTKVDGHATTSATGNYNTSLDVTTSASGKFAANSTYFSKGKHQTILASGAVVTLSSSKSKVEKKRLWQHGSADSAITLQIPSLVHANSSVRSGSETLKLPFKAFLTLFKAEVNTTADNILKLKSVVAGEVISRLAFANKTVSLTKSCVKAYVKTKSAFNNTNDDDGTESSNLFNISLLRAKTYTWTKVVSQTKTEVIVDVLTCTKTRIYGKTVKRGDVVIFTGTGQIAWEKSQITIAAKRAHNLSPHEYGLHFIKDQLQSNSFIQFLESRSEMTM